MHEYNAEDIVACIGSRNVVLIGDSTIRDTFWAIAGKLNPKAASETEIEALKHQNQNFTEAGVNVRFIWDPFLNSTSLQKELDSYRRDSNTAILLVGGGLWHAKHLGATYLSHFKNSIEKIERSINIGSSNVRNPSSRKAAEKPTSKNLLAITPVQVPLYEKLQPLHQEMISPVRVDSLNSCLKNVSSYSQDFVFWSYAHMILNEKSAYDRSGIHCVESISQIRADIIFNVRCNADLVRSKGYPMDKTCCSQYPKLKWVQVVIMLGSLAILPFGIFQVTQSEFRHDLL